MPKFFKNLCWYRELCFWRFYCHHFPYEIPLFPYAIYTKPSSFQEHWTYLDTAAAVRWLEGKLIFFSPATPLSMNTKWLIGGLYGLYISTRPQALAAAAFYPICQNGLTPHWDGKTQTHCTVDELGNFQIPTNIFALSCYLTKNCPAVKKTHENIPWKFQGWGAS